LKLTSRERVAVVSFTGTVTSPKLIEPLHTALGTAIPPVGCWGHPACAPLVDFAAASRAPLRLSPGSQVGVPECTQEQQLLVTRVRDEARPVLHRGDSVREGAL
jgi:hypothetical protein